MPTEQTTPIYWQQFISSSPQILGGKPAITGTRISVEQILGAIAGGHSIEDIQRGLSHLTREQILACVYYALDLVREEEYIAPKRFGHLRSGSAQLGASHAACAADV